jgi:hypothetical protein
VSARLGDFPHKGIQFWLTTRGDNNLRAFTSEELGRGIANPGTGTGNNRNLP